MLMSAREIRVVDGMNSYGSIDLAEQLLAARKANGVSGVYEIINSFGRKLNVELIYKKDDVLPEFDL